MPHLYRGVSASSHANLGGRLIPAGKNVEIVMKRNDCDVGVCIPRDGTFARVPTEENTVRGHHLRSGIHDGCFISTTEDFKIARRFATNEGTTDGYVYVLDTSKFPSAGVISRKLRDPRYPDEQEVSIRAEDGGEIPPSVVVETRRVSAFDYVA